MSNSLLWDAKGGICPPSLLHRLCGRCCVDDVFTMDYCYHQRQQRSDFQKATDLAWKRRWGRPLFRQRWHSVQHARSQQRHSTSSRASRGIGAPIASLVCSSEDTWLPAEITAEPRSASCISWRSFWTKANAGWLTTPSLIIHLITAVVVAFLNYLMQICIVKLKER